MAHFSLTAVGADRPGIVSAVTAVLMREGCNLEDSSMAILRGQFAIMLVVDAPEGTDGEHLERSLSEVAGDLDLVVTVRAIPEDAAPAVTGESWTVSVHGADRPGIVHSVTAYLASLRANVVDLSTRVVGERDHPAYVMLLTVTLPPGVGGDALEEGMERLGGELGVRCRVHPAEADVL